MSKLFIYSNSFVAKTIMFHLEYMLNIAIDEIILLEENHRSENVNNIIDSYNIIICSSIDECLCKCDSVLIVSDSDLPHSICKYISQKASESFKKCTYIDNPWFDYSVCKSGAININNSYFADTPVVLNVSLGPSSQQYCFEVLINKILHESDIAFKQYFSPATHSLIKQLGSQAVNNSIYKQLMDVSSCQIIVISIDIGIDFNGIVNYVDYIRSVKPDFVILQSNVRFFEYDTAMIFFKYGCFAPLDMIIKSHYNTVTMENIKMFYCNNQIDRDGFVTDIESKSIEEEIRSSIFSKLTLPEGVSRV